MDSPVSVASSNDEGHRVKLLCSFLGSIMPRPQDGKLRYVGGETRIISLPRIISYEELMSKMRELYDSAAVLKYQQPDEDLDALVSVVNDDDVINMMEEYEKLGSGDGFTRLRIFLFPHQDPVHYIDGDERETERRYVDALNNLNDGSEHRRQHMDSAIISQMDDISVNDTFYEGLMHSQRGSDISGSQYNLRHVTAPQIYESEGQWSPAYYSPRHYGGHLDPRTVSEFPNSPPSGRYCMQYGDYQECVEEFVRPQPFHHPVHDIQSPFPENVTWMPGSFVSGDKSGFPGNLFHATNGFEMNNSCEHLRAGLHRNQLHSEQSNSATMCNQCSYREPMGLESRMNHGHTKDQNDSHSFFNESFGQERGWVQHQQSPRADDVRMHNSGPGRYSEQRFLENHAINYPTVRGNFVDGNLVTSNYIHHRTGVDMGNEASHDQTYSPAHHVHIAPPDERSGWYNFTQMAQGNVHMQPLRRNAQRSIHGNMQYESSVVTNGPINPACFRASPEFNQRSGSGVDILHQGGESSRTLAAFDGTSVVGYNHGQLLKKDQGISNSENIQAISFDPVHHQCPADLPLSSTLDGHFRPSNEINLSTIGEKLNVSRENERTLQDTLVVPYCDPEPKETNFAKAESAMNQAIPVIVREETDDTLKEHNTGSSSVLEDPELSLNRLSFVPELIASIKKVTLEETRSVMAKEGEAADDRVQYYSQTEAAVESASIEEEMDQDDCFDKFNKIEPTKAEAEAIERGLQTIRNEDLEEVRELGSGTYGAVYHGKWRGSDVAIKRIKASCFAGRPSERERLIADFWKEALILSSLHHPNVVSFYGIVRDGLNGSLATVTEFMVNGSLKQFLQKKDRTIDRRKRLIIAMDAAFGMEYLHGKNIVHFDLKCENLLVNMRDPHRPICKIGDLGLSKVKQHTLVSGGVRGTLPWMAPELLSGKSHMVTEKIDVYSFGIVMWELLSGEEPYAGMHCASIIGGIVNNTLRPEIPSWCDPEWRSLMEMCWASDPAARPSFSEISTKLRSMAASINVK